MLRVIIIFLFVFALTASANALTGCVDVARTRIYNSLHNSGYWRTGNFLVAPAGCFYVYTGGGCKIGNVASNNGILGDDNQLVCPIDDYIGVMVALMGGVGFFIIRQKNMRLAVIP